MDTTGHELIDSIGWEKEKISWIIGFMSSGVRKEIRTANFLSQYFLTYYDENLGRYEGISFYNFTYSRGIEEASYIRELPWLTNTCPLHLI